jgi:hypothetical protein
MAQWIKADGTMQEVKPQNGTDFKLQELYEYTNGGPIEVVHPVGGPYDRMCVLNEEGKLRDLPVNQLATIFYNHPDDVIVGDVLICDDGEVQ